MKATSPAVPLFFAATAGSLLGLLSTLPALPLAALAAVAAIASVLALASYARALGLVALAVALGATAGAWQRESAAQRSAALPEGIAVVEGSVRDVLFGAMGHTRFVIDVSGALPPAHPPTSRVRLEVRALPGVGSDVLPGDRVRVRGAARPFAPAFSPGELDAKKLALARGLDGSMFLVAPFDIVIVERASSIAPFSRARLALRARLASLLPARLAGLELALLVGDTSYLDDEQRAIYRRVGAGHLLAVSGLQVSLIALLLERAALTLLLSTSLGRRGRGRALASVAALLGVWAFVFLCGAPPSAVRAGAMASAVVMGSLFGRRARAFDAIGIAGLLTVLLSPASVLDPSFLLSYGAVLGLAASSLSDNLLADDVTAGKSLVRSLGAIVVASIGAGLVTLPVSAWLFGEIAPAGLVANIVLVPLATIAQVPALALGLLGALLHASFIAWLGAQAALFLEAVAAGLGDLLPGVQPVPAPAGFVAALLVGCALAFAAALAHRHRPAMIASTLAALAVLAASSREPGDLRISVLPVGQGDSAVFQLPDGTVMLVDGGGTYPGRHGGGRDPGADVVVPFLRRRGIEKIDIMVLSHPHPDHAGGLAAVARALPVRTFWHAMGSGSRGVRGPLDGELVRPIVSALPPDALITSTPALLGLHRFGDVTIEVLAPAPAEGGAAYRELGANDNSLVLRVCTGAVCALWPGDIEALGEGLLLEGRPSLSSAVVKAPHHGSRSSSTAAFVQATGAAHVVFCTGPGNHFGFPHEEVAARWHAAGARIWDVARHGELTIHLSPAGASVRAFVD
jgi:competence protein ComEC